ncbi:hypothetical protein HY468_02670, partial [Candidatus Roizmanbacteria bacterium]|nr:hypothetical protein [Candidatus Roizmanbacteria bacterium]
METYNLSVATKKLYEAPLALFTTASLKDLLQVENDMTLFSIIRRLIRSGVIEKIERGKYRLVNSTTGDFELASFLYTPSYISFETALNFYGILSQFPYEVTSATTKKPVKKHIHEKIFSYTRVNRSLFWGYKKDKQALIAEPEKALLDQIYLSSKGLRNAPLDEYDLSRIN